MNGRAGKPALHTRTKKVYQAPQLTAFGKIHMIVAGGSGMIQEGMAMIVMVFRS
jgi:hypothetical protein